MSGRGSIAGSTRVSEKSCDRLGFVTNLASPKERVVSKISEGDILDVNIKLIDNAQIVVVYYESEEVGGITSGAYINLKKCILDGYNYKAEVVSIDKGNVRIKIEPTA